MLILNEPHLHRVLEEYVIHYNGHRPWALGQRYPNARPTLEPPTADQPGHPVYRYPILHGLINEYHQAA